jgi:hypothetical protein
MVPRARLVLLAKILAVCNAEIFYATPPDRPLYADEPSLDSSGTPGWTPAGSLDNPFTSVQECIDALTEPGDECR